MGALGRIVRAPLPVVTLGKGVEDEPRDWHGRWVAAGLAAAEATKGAAAMERVLAGEAHVPAAMHRPDIGAIDFRLGNTRGGVQHIVDEHGIDSARRMPVTIAYGQVSHQVTGRGKQTLLIDHGGYRAVLATSHDDQPGHWLLSGYERTVGKAAFVGSGDPTMNRPDLRTDGLSSLPPVGAKAADLYVGNAAGMRNISMIKDAPGVGAVHVSTALGNRSKRRFIASIADVLLPRIVSAAKRDRSLLPLGTAGMAQVPFPYDPSALAALRSDQKPRFFGALTNPEALPVASLPLADLTAMQNRVDPAKVHAWASGAIRSDKLPVITRFNGRHYIADGHHRLAGAWLRGDAMAQVRLKDLDPVTDAMKRDGGSSDPLGWSGRLDIKKADPDQQLLFGWASVVEKAGRPIIDKQGDIIPVWALEPAAYDFVLHSRDQGDMHRQVGQGRLVESMVFTTDKQKALGIDLGMVGWWTGFKVDSPDLWKSIRAGERPEFSIGGQAVSVEA